VKLTNIHNIPNGIFQRVLANIQKPQPDIIRVSELKDPPLIKKLALENWDTLVADASEFLWSLLGSAIHAELSKANENVLVEIRITENVFGIILSGQIDRYEKDIETIADYKATSTYSFIRGLKPEWEAQLNLYKFLMEEVGCPVKALKIHAILRDWMVTNTVKANYPPIPFQTITVPMWSAEKTEVYIKERIKIHQAEPLPCTMTERWQEPACFAIMKKGQKKAVKASYKDENGEKSIIKTRSCAEVLMADIKKPNLYIEERPSIAKKCKWYCLVRDICPYNFYKKENS